MTTKVKKELALRSIGAVLQREFHKYQKLGTFCDLSLVPGDGRAVLAHSLVLAAANKNLGDLLLTGESGDYEYSIVLPHVGHQELTEAVGDVYCGKSCHRLISFLGLEIDTATNLDIKTEPVDKIDNMLAEVKESMVVVKFEGNEELIEPFSPHDLSFDSADPAIDLNIAEECYTSNPHHFMEVSGATDDLQVETKELIKSKKPKKIKNEHYNYHCEECGRSFQTLFKKARHLVSVHGLKQVNDQGTFKFNYQKCDSCDFNYLDKNDLEEHGVKEHGKLISCGQPGCEKNFPSHTTRIRHEKDIHKEAFFDSKRKYKPRPYVANQIKNLVCDCPQKINFTSEKMRRQHLRNYHSNLPKFPCTIIGCNQIFGRQDTLEKHLGKFHGHQCGDCNRGYQNLEALQNHKCPNQKLDPGLSGFFCDQCGKKLANASSLKEHMFIHDDLKWPCGECPKVFNREMNLKFHIKCTHSKETFLCQICAHPCKNLRTLRSHMANSHLSNEQKRYKCDVCEKGFLSTSKLTDHKMNVHIKSTPYACRYECGKAYNDRSNRRAHEMKFHGSLHQSAIKKMLKTNQYSERTLQICQVLPQVIGAKPEDNHVVEGNHGELYEVTESAPFSRPVIRPFSTL